MKQPWDWIEDDLFKLIDLGVKESIELDYKACDALAQTDGKRKEISKDVSAFANSAGGTIVYGIVEKGHVPDHIDIGFDPALISKEWLEQVINSRIHRRIDGIRINQIELEQSSPGKVAYAVYVPQSSRAPHQAVDWRFYKRFNFESVPMEEYEVRDVSMRSEAPDLRISYNLSSDQAHQPAPDSEQQHIGHVQLIPIISNESPIPAEYIVVSIYIDSRLQTPNGTSGLSHGGEQSLMAHGQTYPCRRLDLIHSIPGKIPIFQGLPFQLLSGPLRIAIPAKGRYIVGWRLNSPGMKERLDATFLVWDGTNVTLERT